MKTFMNSLLGTLAALAVVALLVGGGAAVMAGKKDPIEDRSWLVVALQGELPEYDPPGGVLSKITGEDAETLTRVLDNLRKARVDDRIEGVIVKVAMESQIGGAASQEIRAAIKRLREGGKKVYGWAESFDAKDYYVLAACDEILAPETAYINFTGLSSGSLHVKNALDKLGISANVHQIKDYKSAAEMITRENMSEPARQNREWLLGELWDFMIRDLKADRGFDEPQVVSLMEQAIFTAPQAKEARLIDGMMYWDQVEEKLKGKDDEKLLTVSMSRYADEKTSKLDLDGDRTIAIVHAQGTIGGRKSGVNPLLGVMMGHETIIAELRRAREDDDVAAIIFRVDSRGGDALGSDLMGHEVEVTAAEKPIVVSMVDHAASGGYHISYRASKIVADEATITGSIGSINAKFNVRSMWGKAGVTHDELSRGPNALFYSAWHDFTPEERKRFEEDHWEGFNMWLRDVAEHRGKGFEEAEKLAHGRVWTGRQAKENGLIDEMGDLEFAVQLAKGLAGIPAEDKVTRVHYPKAKGLVESILAGDMATAARWAVYRAMREEVAASWSLVRNPSVLNAALED
jgi:protease-4